MKDELKTKAQLCKELVAMRTLNNFLIVSAAQHRQRLEKTLLEEQQFTEILLDTTGGLVRNFVAAVMDTPKTLVVVLDTQGRIVSFNRTCEVLTDYSFDEVKGKLVWDLLVVPTEVDTVKAMFASLQSDEVLNEYESGWVTRDGSHRRISWSNKLLRKGNGEVNYLVSIGVDITWRVQAELELNEYKQHLETLVGERTASLMQVNQQLQREIGCRARVEEELRQQSKRERLMGLITQRIRQSLSLEEILNAAVGQVRSFLEAERVAIYQILPEQDGQFVVESVAPSCSSLLGVNLHEPCFDKKYVLQYKHGRVSAIDNVKIAEIHPCYIQFLNKLGIRANLVVPIVANNELWGLLCAHQCSAPRHWQSWETDLLFSLANQLAIAIQQAEIYQQLQLANIELQCLASSDGLTKLACRRYFDEYLSKEWQRSIRDQIPLSLILCDIDFFKTYNDTYGHIAGDKCLQQVAKAISRAAKRPTDLVARYGGEEFAVILPNTDVRGAVHVAELICLEVRDLKITHASYPVKQYVTISVGVASMIGERESEPSALILDADKALYQAKASGRDRVVLNRTTI